MYVQFGQLWPFGHLKPKYDLTAHLGHYKCQAYVTLYTITHP